MSANVSYTVDLKERQWEFLSKMSARHGLGDESKALRVLIDYAIQDDDQEAKIFTEIRCLNC